MGEILDIKAVIPEGIKASAAAEAAGTAKAKARVKIAGGGEIYDDYTGSYDITPMVTSQTMQTKNKHMTDDVLIRVIPTREAPNEAGGVTFVIGG